MAKEHNLGALAMSKRGTGRTVAVKAETVGTATSASTAVSAASSVDVEDRLGLTDCSSNSSSGNAISSTAAVDADVKVDIDALPCSPSKSVARDSLLVSSQAHRVAALNIGLAGAAASDVINRYDPK